jgi:hypothetical protein
VEAAMQYIRVYVIIVFVFVSGFARADFFPIGAYDCDSLNQAKSGYFNLVRFTYTGDATTDAFLDDAATLDMKVILSRAQRSGTQDIVTMSSGLRWIYEAESDSFDHDLGGKVFDPDAENDTAWVVCGTVSGRCQDGLWTQNELAWERDSLYANFRLKIDDTTYTGPVCSLLILRKVDDNTYRDTFRVLTPRDFSANGVYDRFQVKFEVPEDTSMRLDYAISYMGTEDSLYSDRVILWDEVGNTLFCGDYNGEIYIIADHYRQKSALFRYYLKDEPLPRHFGASGYVNDRLKYISGNHGGIQAMCYKQYLAEYLDSVDTDELFVDCYPLYGGHCGYTWQYVPVDSGSELQERFDSLCSFLGEARATVKSVAGKEFWFIPQTFGQGLSDSNSTWDPDWNTNWLHDSASTGWWREPSPRELRCMVWLGLAYGAKGICYYIYHSAHHYFWMPQWQGFVWDVGLTNGSGSVKRPIWSTVQAINEELETIGPTLLTLISDTVFKHPGLDYPEIPSDCFIDYISGDDTVQVGTFLDTDNDSFFIIVNRLCQETDYDCNRSHQD